MIKGLHGKKIAWRKKESKCLGGRRGGDDGLSGAPVIQDLQFLEISPLYKNSLSQSSLQLQLCKFLWNHEKAAVDGWLCIKPTTPAAVAWEAQSQCALGSADGRGGVQLFWVCSVPLLAAVKLSVVNHDLALCLELLKMKVHVFSSDYSNPVSVFTWGFIYTVFLATDFAVSVNGFCFFAELMCSVFFTCFWSLFSSCIWPLCGTFWVCSDTLWFLS